MADPIAEEMKKFLEAFGRLLDRLEGLLDREGPLTTEQARKYLQVNRKQLLRYRRENPPLPCHPISVDGSRNVEMRYFRKELDEWLKDRFSLEEIAYRKAQRMVKKGTERRKAKYA